MIESITGTAAVPATQTVKRNDNIDRDAWIKLLVAQMTRGQDPMNPMNPDQMAAQLAQFSSVEQLMNIRDELKAMSGANAMILNALHGSSALGTLGRTVTAIGDQVVINDGVEASVRASVSAPGGTGVLKIYDAAGRIVGERQLGYVAAGTTTFEVGSAADGLAPGIYRYGIDVTGDDDAAVAVQTYTQARIDGIRHGPNGPMLTAGELEIPLIAVIEVLN